MKLKKSIVAMALVASMICGSTMNLWAAEMTVKNTAVQYGREKNEDRKY